MKDNDLPLPPGSKDKLEDAITAVNNASVSDLLLEQCIANALKIPETLTMQTPYQPPEQPSWIPTLAIAASVAILANSMSIYHGVRYLTSELAYTSVNAEGFRTEFYSDTHFELNLRPANQKTE